MKRRRACIVGAAAALGLTAQMALVGCDVGSGGTGSGSSSVPASSSTARADGSSGAATSTGSVDVVAVGDMVCGAGQAVEPEKCAQSRTVDVAADLKPDVLLALGDLQYDEGSAADFEQAYDPTWGRLKSITRPVAGNHEYRSPGAAPYFDYFGERAGEPGKGWYSFDLGAWHVVALNSNCDQIDCGPDSEQLAWLRADLAASRAACTLAYWHHPRWSNSKHGDDEAVDPFVQALDDAGADVVLTGHDHIYQRFEPRSADGDPTPDGIREFVVGTGGRSLYALDQGEAGLDAWTVDEFGVLDLTLHDDGYDWRFVPVSGPATDAGSATCRSS